MEVAHYTYSAMALRKYRTLASGMARHGDQSTAYSIISTRVRLDAGALALRPNASRSCMVDRCTSDLGSVLFHAVRRAHEQAECTWANMEHPDKDAILRRGIS
jgi:hypothetical protein